MPLSVCSPLDMWSRPKKVDATQVVVGRRGEIVSYNQTVIAVKHSLSLDSDTKKISNHSKLIIMGKHTGG